MIVGLLECTVRAMASPRLVVLSGIKVDEDDAEDEDICRRREAEVESLLRHCIDLVADRLDPQHCTSSTGSSTSSLRGVPDYSGRRCDAGEQAVGHDGFNTGGDADVDGVLDGGDVICDNDDGF
ncbi:hypothetical protein MTO96_007842 [Rhipicephalus appendiculatus]